MHVHVFIFITVLQVRALVVQHVLRICRFFAQNNVQVLHSVITCRLIITEKIICEYGI